jgi:hypothetical protein
MKNNYKNTLIALILTIVIIIGGSFIVDAFNKDNSNKMFASKTDDTKKSSNEIVKDEETTSSKENTNNDVIVVEDTSTSAAIESSNVGSDIVVDTATSVDSQALEYFNAAESKIDSMADNIDKVKTEGKALFVKLVDFIFYDTEINGIKFNDLTAATQEKLVAIANSVDSKIESKLPGYKETVVDYTGKTYTYLSDKLKQGITYVDTKIGENINPDTYAEVKEETSGVVDTIKESVGTAIDISKETLAVGKEKLQKWYEGWK